MHFRSSIDPSPLKLDETMDYGNYREAHEYYGMDTHRGRPTHYAPYPYPPIPAMKQQPIVPHNNDILMGRGGKNNQHVGNETFRKLARLEAVAYSTAGKKVKSNIAKGLVTKVRQMQPAGRFLKRNPITSEWEDVGDEYAREKASQVLRDAVALLEETTEKDALHDKKPAHRIEHSGRATQHSKKRAHHFEDTPELFSETSYSRFPPLKRARVITPAAATPPYFSNYATSPPSWHYQAPFMPTLTPPSMRRCRSNNFFERSAFFTSSSTPTPTTPTRNNYNRSDSARSLVAILASPALSREGSLCASLTGDLLPGENFLLTSNHERQQIADAPDWDQEDKGSEEFLSEFF